MDLDPFQKDNLANWNDRVDVHAASDDYGLRRYAQNADHISDGVAFDKAWMGDVAGCALAHLQCHIGTDTISLARLGAEVTGLDFSDKAIVVARALAESSGTPAQFVVGNVYDAPALLGPDFDFVYTGVGAINWLADLHQWAAAVAGVLKPGGRLYLREAHPQLWVFEEVDGQVVPTYDYVTSRESPLSWDEAETYTDGDASVITHTRSHGWNHSLPDILNALVGSGMTVNRMAEHQGLDWRFVPSAVKEGTQWFLPGELRRQVPAMFSLWATKDLSRPGSSASGK